MAKEISLHFDPDTRVFLRIGDNTFAHEPESMVAMEAEIDAEVAEDDAEEVDEILAEIEKVAASLLQHRGTFTTAYVKGKARSIQEAAQKLRVVEE